MNNDFNIIGLGEVLWDVFPDGPRFGGAPANWACAIAGLMGEKANVFIISSVGNDQLGSDASKSFEQRNVDVSKLQSSAFATGTVTVKLDELRQASYEFAENCAWDNIVSSEQWHELTPTTDAICFGSLAQRSDISKKSIQAFVSELPSTTLKVFDINLRAPFYTNETILQSLELANVLKLNEEELPIIANMLGITGDTQSLLKQIQDKFQLNTIALTLGAEGAVLIHHDQQVEVPIVPTTVVDTVGAGDSFTAALTLGLLLDKPLLEIALFATKVSSYVCSQRGATPQLSPAMFTNTIPHKEVTT
jgi:fructokinase